MHLKKPEVMNILILYMTKIWRIHKTAHKTCMSFFKPIIMDRINGKLLYVGFHNRCFVYVRRPGNSQQMKRMPSRCKIKNNKEEPNYHQTKGKCTDKKKNRSIICNVQPRVTSLK